MPRNKQPENNKIYQIVIGVNNYKELNPLRYAASTARLIAELIKSNTQKYLNETGKYLNIELEQLLFHDENNQEKQPIYEEVTQAIEQICKNAKQGDEIQFIFIGHGDPDKFLYLTDTEKNNKETQLGFDYLVENLCNSKASKIGIFIDSCHSGNLKFSLSEYLYNKFNITNQQHQHQQDYYAILSCDATESSYEFSSLEKPICSHFYIKALQSGVTSDTLQIKAIDLFSYIQTRMNDYLTRNQCQKVIISELGIGNATPNPHQQDPKWFGDNPNKDFSIFVQTTQQAKSIWQLLVIDAKKDEQVKKAEEETWITILQKQGYIYDFWEARDKHSLQKLAELTIKGTLLLYLRGYIKDDNFYLKDENVSITKDELLKKLQEKKQLRQIILLDCLGATKDEITKFAEGLKIPLNMGQCIIASATPNNQPDWFANHLKTILNNVKKEDGLLAVNLIYQLQNISQEHFSFLLTAENDTGIVEVLPADILERSFQDADRWRAACCRIVNNKLSSSPLDFGNNGRFDLYVDLESLSSSTSSISTLFSLSSIKLSVSSSSAFVLLL
jgi:hypothetical protein